MHAVVYTCKSHSYAFVADNQRGTATPIPHSVPWSPEKQVHRAIVNETRASLLSICVNASSQAFPIDCECVLTLSHWNPPSVAGSLLNTRIQVSSTLVEPQSCRFTVICILGDRSVVLVMFRARMFMQNAYFCIKMPL